MGYCQGASLLSHFVWSLPTRPSDPSTHLRLADHCWLCIRMHQNKSLTQMDRFCLENGKRCVMWDDEGAGFYLVRASTTAGAVPAHLPPTARRLPAWLYLTLQQQPAGLAYTSTAPAD